MKFVSDNRSAPKAAVVPMLMYQNVAAAIDWLARAFGVSESLRFTDSQGRVTHAQLIIHQHEIMVGWPGPGAKLDARSAAPSKARDEGR
jgi:uncharacterized glyoxalase superfamily protein PhnB